MCCLFSITQNLIRDIIKLKQKINMSKADVVNEIHKNARVNFSRRHVIMKGIDDLWQADLIDMQSVSKENKKIKFILIVIDTFSKYAWAFPLKCMTKDVVSNTFKMLLNKGRVPKNLQTDNGTEFYNNMFQKLMKSYNINHYSTFSTKKASIVERLIRTLKSKLYKEFSLKGNYKWIDNTLDNVVYTYNHTQHRTIDEIPANVNKKNTNRILMRYASLVKNVNIKSKFKVDDYVRISKYKGTFEKGYTPNWSTEIFKIKKIQNTTPITYLIEDTRGRPILGAFYAQELQKTKHPTVYLVEKILKSKGNRVLVKWLGLPPSENSWIDKSNKL